MQTCINFGTSQYIYYNVNHYNNNSFDEAGYDNMMVLCLDGCCIVVIKWIYE